MATHDSTPRRRSVKESVVGQRFGRWLVVAEAPKPEGGRPSRYWLCRCDCGVERVMRGRNLYEGKSRSCGCLARDIWRSQKNRLTHGMTGHPDYNIWLGMVERCHDPNNKAYSDYGDRGIRVCAKWRRSPAAFFEDMGPRPSRAHTLDRIDNDGPYAPGNCRWATRDIQNRNSRRNRYIEFQGERMTAMDWAVRLGMPSQTIYQRIAAGLPAEMVLSTRRLRRGTCPPKKATEEK